MLIVVLGILALLTVMAVSFVFATRLSLRASEAYMRTVTATDIAEAGAAAAIYTLRADKMFRTGDPENPHITPTQTYDSLQDIWRQRFSAPVVLQYQYAATEPTFDLSAGALPITVTNTSPYDTSPYRQDATANVIAIDTANNRLYIDSVSTALWKYTDAANRDTITVWQDATRTFSAPLAAAPAKPDEVDLDGDGTNDAIWHNYYDETGVLIGRYAVLIQDESSKLNINVSGNLASINASSKDYTTYTPSWNEGWSTFETSLTHGLNTTAGNARNIVLYRNGRPSSGASRPFARITYADVPGEDTLAIGQTITNTTNSEIGKLQFFDATANVLYVGIYDKNPPNEQFPWLWANGQSVQNGLGFTATISSVQKAPSNRIFVGGQGNLRSEESSPQANTFDDDDDDRNRVLYRYDGIDNDGDRTTDEWDEGVNEPEEFRPLVPIRLRPEVGAGFSPLEYDGIDNDGDGTVDETNEADDQPILTLEQLTDSQGVAIPDPDSNTTFLTETISTNFDGATNRNIERRHLMSALSHDRNLTKDGEVRTNPNFATPEQLVKAVQKAFPLESRGDTNSYERADLRNMQVAANIYDYRDRNHSQHQVVDAAGNIFAGVETIRINEVMVRPATATYEAETELPDANGYWSAGSNPVGQGAGSPRGTEGYLNNPGLTGNPVREMSDEFTFTLPNPPFTSTGGPNGDGTYPFKLRMRVRSYDQAGSTANYNLGFLVYINDPSETGVPVGIGTTISSFFGTSVFPPRWATHNRGTGVNNWYIEEAIVWLNSGSNSIHITKPAVNPGEPQDTVEVDWFYFTQEPDCEWLELVNLGNQTVNVNGWKLVSEYVKDQDESAVVSYYKERYELTLDVPEPPGMSAFGIPPVDSTTNPYLDAPQGSPKFVVFAIDRLAPDYGNPTFGEDVVGYAGAGATNGIDYLGTFVGGIWKDIQSLAAVQMVYQLSTISNIYTGWIDFFGNEPFNDPSDDTIPTIDARGTPADSNDDVNLKVDIARVSLYDSAGNLVDSVTYDRGNVAPFCGLQREYPSSPGDRLDTSNNFKMRSYLADQTTPSDDYNVLADGAYDDWKPQDGEEGSSTPARANFNLTSSHYALIKYAPTDKNGSPVNEDSLIVGTTITNTSKNPSQTATIEYVNTDGNADYMLVSASGSNRPATWQAGDDIRTGTFSSRIRFIDAGAAMFDIDESDPNLDFKLSNGKVKNRFISSPGELGFLPYFNEYVAAIRYSDSAFDSGLTVGDVITNTSTSPQETATILAVDTNENYLVLRGIGVTDFVANWYPGQVIQESGTLFDTKILYLKPEHSLMGDEIEYYAVIEYDDPADPDTDVNLAVGDTITNTTITPNETALVTAIDTDGDGGAMIVRGFPPDNSPGSAPDAPPSQWRIGDTISNGGSPGFSGTIRSAQSIEKTADTRGLADYFTTSFIDLEAAAGTATGTSADPATDWAQTATNWPNPFDPATYETTANGASFSIQWGGNAGVQNGSYDLYVVAESSAMLDIQPRDASGNPLGSNLTNAVPTVEPYAIGAATYLIGAIYYGPVTIADGTLTLNITNKGPAGLTARFLRAVLTPAPQTFGRINVNTASERTLRALRQLQPNNFSYVTNQYPYVTVVTYNNDSSETYLAQGQTITNSTIDDNAVLVGVDTANDKLWLLSSSPIQWGAEDNIDNGIDDGSATPPKFQSQVSSFTPPALGTIPLSVVQARNMAAFQSIGDIYQTSQIDPGFNETVFKNISNLVTTRSDIYNIIVYGQSVNDADNDGIVSSGEILATKKLEVLYQR
ncbi:MAG: hypothetical protein Kow0099_22360 [Candidatus Abyssubacteria bacterium]